MKTDGRSYNLQEEFVKHPGSASTMLLELGVTFRRCRKYVVEFISNFDQTFLITPELVVL